MASLEMSISNIVNRIIESLQSGESITLIESKKAPGTHSHISEDANEHNDRISMHITLDLEVVGMEIIRPCRRGT